LCWFLPLCTVSICRKISLEPSRHARCTNNVEMDRGVFPIRAKNCTELDCRGFAGAAYTRLLEGFWRLESVAGGRQQPQRGGKQVEPACCLSLEIRFDERPFSKAAR